MPSLIANVAFVVSVWLSSPHSLYPFRPLVLPHRPSQALLVVEALMNVCGVSFLPNGYGAFDEFNLRKFTAACCGVAATAADAKDLEE